MSPEPTTDVVECARPECPRLVDPEQAVVVEFDYAGRVEERVLYCSEECRDQHTDDMVYRIAG